MMSELLMCRFSVSCLSIVGDSTSCCSLVSYDVIIIIVIIIISLFIRDALYNAVKLIFQYLGPANAY